MKYIISIALLLLSSYAHAEVRFNSLYNTWEGNACLTNLGLFIIPQWLPIGSNCTVLLPDGRFVSGFIYQQ